MCVVLQKPYENVKDAAAPEARYNWYRRQDANAPEDCVHSTRDDPFGDRCE